MDGGGAGLRSGGAVLSHDSAAALLGIGSEGREIEISVRPGWDRRLPGIRVHRRRRLESTAIGTYARIPVTSPAQTLIDLSVRHDRMTVERMVDEADRLDLIAPPALRAELHTTVGSRGWPGCAPGSTGAPSGSRARDWSGSFCRWRQAPGCRCRRRKSGSTGSRSTSSGPALRLVVETDSLRHHRTPAQQSRDHRRDQAHTAAGFTSLRFTHEQVRYEPEHVRSVLTDVARRLGVGGAHPGP